jgi:hypothetical protein
MQPWGPPSSRDPIFDAETQDAADIVDRVGEFGDPVIVDACFEGGQDPILGGALDREDERDAEARPVGGIERGKALELFRGQPVEPGAGLLSFGIIGQFTGDRGPPGQIRMGAQDGAPLVARGIAQGAGKSVDDRVAVGEGAGGGGPRGNPGRLFRDIAERDREFAGRHPIQIVNGAGHACAPTDR